MDDEDNYGNIKSSFTYTTIGGYQYKVDNYLEAVLLKDEGSLSEILSEIKKSGVKKFINPNDEIYLIAVWDSPMNISFDGNGGTGHMNSINTTTAATGMYIPYCKYEKKGSRCVGWKIYFSDDRSWYCTWNDGKKCKSENDASLMFPDFYDSSYGFYLDKTYGRSIKLVAEYELNTTPLTIKFDANGGTGEMHDQYVGTETVIDETLEKYPVDVYKSVSINKNEFIKEGYKFVGWHATLTYDNDVKSTTSYCYTDGGVKKFYYPCGNNYVVLKDTAELYGIKYGDRRQPIVTLTAQWEPEQSYTVKYDANGGSGYMAEQAVPYSLSTPISKNAFKYDGYVFNGWTAKRGGGTWYCYTDNAKNKVEWVNASVCSKYGYYKFNDQQKILSIGNPGGTVTMYAQWSKNKFTVKYNAGGGVGTMSDQIMTYGVSTAMNANRFTRNGYSFTGWHAKRDDGTWYCYTNSSKKSKGWVTSEDTCKKYGYYLYSDQAKLSNTAPSNHYVTMYAQWKSNHFTLKFNAGGGTGSMSNQNITYGVPTAISANRFTRSGYAFTGWHAKRDDGKWYCYTNPVKTSTVNQTLINIFS